MPYTDYLRKAHAPAARSRRPPPSSFGYRGYGDPRLVTPLLSQFLILSVLLHMLALLLFGSPSGGSRDGRALWGSLDVTLVPAFQAPAPPLRMERSFGLAPKPVPRARPPMPAPRVEPAQTKPARPVERKPAPEAPPVVPASPSKTLEAVPPAPPTLEPPPAPPAPPAPAQELIVVPRMIERLATPETKRDIEPAFQVPLPTKAQVVGPPRNETSAQSVASPKPEPSPALPTPKPERAPSAAAPRRETLAPPPIEAPLITERLATPRIERTLAEPPVIAAPVVPPPAPERASAPAIEPPPLAAPAVPVVPPAAPIERVPIEVAPAQATAPAMTQPSPPPAERATVQEAPAAATPSVESLPAASAKTESATAKPAPSPASPPSNRALPAQSTEARGAPEVSSSIRPSPKPEAIPARPSAVEASAPSAPRGEGDPLFTAPRGDAAPSPFGDLPTGRAAPDTGRAPPTLDLDAMRKRAGQIAREGSGNRAVLPFPMPPVPKKKDKMQQAIENARKPDCRNAYSALGLAAIVPLIANEFGEGTCRW